jgi:ZIP family zinc transporter
MLAAVAGALVLGAAWGLYGHMPTRLKGFIIALGGGAMVQSLMADLLQPSADEAGILLTVTFVGLGAGLFTLLDYLVDDVWASTAGFGLLLAATLDGVPESLALGVEMIGTGPMGAAALAGAIFLSNLPEAAGGAAQMRDAGMKPRHAMILWTLIAVLLAGATIAGNLYLTDLHPEPLAAIRCLAAGAVVSSLATEVFPQAFKDDHQLSGIAVALGLVLAVMLGEVGG